MMASSILPSLVIQRNGKPRACETCRKRKVACDHGYPVCARCDKRGEASTCVYEKDISERGMSALAESSARSRSTSPATLESRARSYRSREQDVLGRSERGASSSLVNPSGYLGPTSVSALLQTTQGISPPGYNPSSPLPGISSITSSHGLNHSLPLTPCISHIGSDRRSPPSLQGSDPLRTEFRNDDKSFAGGYGSCFERAVHALKRLPKSEDDALAVFNRNVNPNDCLMRWAGRRIISSTLDMLKKLVRGPSDEVGYRQLAQLIIRNTEVPMIEKEQEGGMDWLEPFIGSDLRWEAVAVVFVYLFLGTIAFIPPGKERKEVLIQYKECISICITLSDTSKNANVLLLYALYKRSTIQASIHGDASLANWTDHAETVAMLTFLGLHAQCSPVHDIITPLSEIRKRLFCQIYIMDKVTATFCGRPSLLAKRYCKARQPIVIDDDALCYGRRQTAAAWWGAAQEVSRSEDAALNVQPVTILRARHSLAENREDILELINASYCEMETVVQLGDHAECTWNNIPNQIRYNSDDDPRHIASELPYTRLLVRLEHLLNLFFLERLRLSHEGAGDSHPSSVRLVGISFEMVRLTVQFWTHKDRLVGYQGESELFVIAFAESAAGVLCNELANPCPETRVTQQGSWSKEFDGIIPRSEMVQQLSLFIGFLEWIGPEEPNADFVLTAKQVIHFHGGIVFM